jgi:hypothetical protein
MDDSGLVAAILIVTWIIIIVMIGTTVGAWVRGWKGWSLIPIAVFIAFNWILPVPEGLALAGVVAALIASIVMVATGRKKQPSENTGPMAQSVQPQSFPQQLYPQADQPKTTFVSATTVYKGAKLIMPDNSEIPVTETRRPFGRTDFDRMIPPVSANIISRQHFWVKGEFGKYYIEDTGSSNGTRLNGVEIKGRGLQEIRNGDRIDLGGATTVTFRI